MSRCQDTATNRAERGTTMPMRFWQDYPCPHPAKFRVLTNANRDRLVCGRHAKQYSVVEPVESPR